MIVASAAVTLSAAFVACNKGEDKVELKNYADSMAYYQGLVQGEDLMLQSDQESKDILKSEAFMRGMEAAFADTTKEYILGLQMGIQYHASIHSMSVQSGLDINATKFMDGFRKAISADSISEETMLEDGRVLDSLGYIAQRKAMESLAKTMSENAKHPRAQADQKFVDNLKAADNTIQTTQTGLSYKIKEYGTGETAQVGSTVKVKYVGRLTDGTEFDSSHDTFVDFPVDPRQVIPGFAEALATLPGGTKATLYIPQDLAYGINDNGPIPAGATLIFDIEIGQ